jgi:hypothetical protein
MPHGGTLARRGGRPGTPGVLAGDQRASCDHALLVRLLADMRLKRCRNKGKNRLPKGTPAALRARPPGCLPAAAWLRRPALQKHVNRGRLFACWQGPLELVTRLVMYATTPPLPDPAPDASTPRLRGAASIRRRLRCRLRRTGLLGCTGSRLGPRPDTAVTTQHPPGHVTVSVGRFQRADSSGPDSHDTPPGQGPQLTGISRSRRPTVRRGRLAGPGRRLLGCWRGRQAAVLAGLALPVE